MKINKINEKKNPLFNRREITFEIENNVIPSYTDLTEIISKEYSAEKGSIKILKVHTKFGINKFVVEANIYNSREEKDKVEVKSKKDKLMEEAEAKAKAATETPVPEAQ